MNYESILKRRPDALAYLRGDTAHGEICGRVRFYKTGNAVLVAAEFTGLPAETAPCERPILGFHIHQGTQCTGDETDPFANTLGHYNPDDCAHPYHAGDMPPIFSCHGRGLAIFLTDRFSIREIIGKTVVLHAMPDDFHTQPSGNSGMKIACGKILSQ